MGAIPGLQFCRLMVRRLQVLQAYLTFFMQMQCNVARSSEPDT